MFDVSTSSPWLCHQAWKFEISPGRLIKIENEFWLENEKLDIGLSESFRQLWKIDVLPRYSIFQTVLQTRGLNLNIEILQVDISNLCDVSKEHKISRDGLRNYFKFNLRYCPICWKNERTRYFKILWRLPYIMICLEHGAELKEKCPKCNETLFDESSIKDLQHSNILTCKYCDYSLINEKINEDNHLIEIQYDILDNLRFNSIWATNRSYLIFWNSFRLAFEQNRNQDVLLRLKSMNSILQAEINAKTSFICPKCTKNDFKSMAAYIDHVWACQKVHICPKCGLKCFNTKSSYEKHVWACQEQHTCPNCSKSTFDSKSSYDDHVWACKTTPICPL